MVKHVTENKPACVAHQSTADYEKIVVQLVLMMDVTKGLADQAAGKDGA